MPHPLTTPPRVLIGIVASTFCRSATLCALARERLTPQANLAVMDWRKGSDYLSFLEECDVALVGREKFTSEGLQRLSRLKLVAKYGVGLDNIDLGACAARAIAVRSQPGVNAPWVAEQTIGMAIGLLRNLALSSRQLASGTWRRDGGRSLIGKTVGIVGCGAIGSRVARMARSAFACPILINDIADREEFCREIAASQVSLDELTSRADVITLHVPLTELTGGLFDERRLSTLRPHQILINTARGPVVDVAAIKKLLVSGRLGGAAIDVYDPEPLVDPELFNLPNFFGTPHIAGNAAEAVYEMGAAAVRSVEEWLVRGRP